MCRIILTLSAIITLATTASAQPDLVWFRAYHNDNYDHFWDIYPPNDGGYVMCGNTNNDNRGHRLGSEMWVVRIDDNGNIIWTGTYGDPEDFDEGTTIIEVDDGGFLVGGQSGAYHENHKIAAWRLDEDGEQEWFRTYGTGMCHAAIELKAGEFLLTGGTYGGGTGFLKCIGGDGDLLWERFYNPGVFRGMRETVGGVVLAGMTSNFNIWVVKVSIAEEGEIIWSREYSPFIENCVYSIVSAHEDGFVLSGRSLVMDPENNRILNFFTFKIDDDGNQDWVRSYDISDRFSGEWSTCIERYPHNGYILVGHIGLFIEGGVIRITSAGVPRWERIYDQLRNQDEEVVIDLTSLESVIIDHEGSAIAAGWGMSRGGGIDGVVIKLEPEHLEPQFIVYSPEDTMLTVLQGDTVEFWVSAHDAQGDELSYLWIMGVDTLSRDTTVNVEFNEQGDFDLQCQVTDEEYTVGITWHVRVMAFYIESFTPDTLEMTVRRNSSVDFALEVRTLEDVEFNYLWTLTGRGQQRQVGEEESVSVLFDLTGDYRLEGMVWSDEAADVVDWTIHVRSVIWYWWPEANALSLPGDSRQEFTVFPFNPDSDSLSYLWYLNDEQLDVEDTMFVVTVEFSDVGDHTLASIVHDGCEVDTVTWEVDVYDPWRTTSDDVAPLPDCVALFDPRPNPFNASTTISYQLPEPGEVSIGIYDIHGRLVTTLVEGKTNAGFQSVVWDGSNVPSGIYFCRMEAVGYSRSVKMVLVR